MRIHWLQHVSFENLGTIETWAQEHGHSVACTRLYENQPLPQTDDFDWLIVMGGSMGVYDTAQYPWLNAEKTFIRQAIEHGKAVLGICLGAQLIAAALGAAVTKNAHKEIGWWPVRKNPALANSLWADCFPAQFEVFQWHGDTFALPAGAVAVGSGEACENQGFVYQNRVIALQFHLEMTAGGLQALIANCAAELVPAPYIQTAAQMSAQVRKFAEINRLMACVLEFLAAV